MTNINRTPIRIVVVDDHILFREGLVAIIRSEPDVDVIGQAGTVREAVLVQTHRQADPKTGHASFVQTTTVFDVNGNATKTETELKGPATEGLSYTFRPLVPQQARQFDSYAADLVAFLAFITDPSQMERKRIGVWFLVFLAFFSVIAWRLNSVYWKNIK